MLRHPDLIPHIVDSLRHADYLVLPDAVEDEAVAALRDDLLALGQADRLQPASVGRGDKQRLRADIRGDLTCWLQPDSPVQARWLDTMEPLRQALNRALFLGLDNYEAHYARYDAGQFYRRHLDSFHGNNPRRISTVLYLNADWSAADGGLLQLYPGNETVAVVPRSGTLAIFLSEQVPHEVTAANRTRYSVAGWFRRQE